MDDPWEVLETLHNDYLETKEHGRLTASLKQAYLREYVVAVHALLATKPSMPEGTLDLRHQLGQHLHSIGWRYVEQTSGDTLTVPAESAWQALPPWLQELYCCKAEAVVTKYLEMVRQQASPPSPPTTASSALDGAGLHERGAGLGMDSDTDHSPNPSAQPGTQDSP